MVPTIGVLESLPNRPQSGSILLMTDSDCLNGDRTIKDCLKLMEYFVQIATAPSQHERRIAKEQQRKLHFIKGQKNETDEDLDEL